MSSSNFFRPKDIYLSPLSFDEDIESSSLVAYLSTIDQDVGDTHSYSFVSGEGDEDNELFNIEEIQFNGIVYELTDLLSSSKNLIPDQFAFYQPFPNPFNPKTTITFDLPEEMEVNLNVFDINGRLVQTLNRSKLRAGNYSFDWEGTDQFGMKVTSGVYFIRIDAGSFKSIKKTLLVK